MSTLGRFRRRGSNKKELQVNSDSQQISSDENISNKDCNNQRTESNIISRSGRDENNKDDDDKKDDVLETASTDDYDLLLDMTAATDTSGENTTKTPVGVTIAFLRHQEAAKTGRMGRSVSDCRLTLDQNMPYEAIRPSKLFNKSSSSGIPKSRRGRSRSGGSRGKNRRRSSKRKSQNKVSTRSAYKKPVSSFRIFLEGSFLYLTCLVLPSFIGYLYQNYYYYNENKSWNMNTVFQMIGIEKGNTNATTVSNSTGRSLNEKEMDPITSLAYSYGYWAYEEFSSRVCPTDVRPDSYSAWMGCPVAPAAVSPAYSIYSPDITQTSWKEDATVVAVTAIVLALIRFILVKALAPTSLHDTKSISAMVRCKSISLLSSDYQSTLTPTCSRKILSSFVFEQENQTVDNAAPAINPPPFIPPLALFSEDSGNLGLRLDDDDGKAGPTPFSSPRAGKGGTAAVANDDDGERDSENNKTALQRGQGTIIEEDALLRATDYDGSNHSDDDDDHGVSGSDGDEDDEYEDDADDESSHNSFEHKIEYPGGILPLSPLKKSSLNVADTAVGGSSFSSLYAAPRFATAVFRFLYSVTASGLAYHWFASSHFWPRYLGGQGSTAKCWDLNGLGVTMDSDFDHRNLVLKNYFLWQASYHLHSWAFDLCLAVLTLTKRGSSTAIGVSSCSLQSASPPTSSNTTARYLRSLLQHFVALVLIAVAYVFSSLRRLAAIAMFSFDVSSCFLHLLQICLNANETSTTKRKKTIISIIYYGMVLPSFVLLRFGVWPALWYSATFESQNWFRQLESVLVPRAALVVQIIVQCWILLCMILTAVYFRRLCKQPHLQRILQAEDGRQ